MAEVSTIDVHKLERKIDALSGQIGTVNQNIAGIGDTVDETRKELNDLRQRFEEMMNEQKRTAILQKAATELVRVRQEIEQNFGNYKVIRETMLGVLQATDLALVKKTTISKVSEELMLSTPKYWLAPCLVAVSAWIGNDRDLANRAIAEAVKRDEERTALVMALICRRNNKVDACYEWLSIYFSNQNAAHFSEGSFVYIDAYVNGVFGPDTKHMCDDYIDKWLTELKGSSSTFEESQKEIWKKYCETFTCGMTDTYPELSECVVEYDKIEGYMGRIVSIDSISSKIDGMVNATVNQEQLKEVIDKKLIELISRHNEDEEPLRREEAYLKAIRKYDGDEDKAKAEMVQKKARREKDVMNLVEQMTSAITTEEDVLPSQRKTAISFLGNYITKGFDSYIEEKKSDFPESITININEWTGTTTDGENVVNMQKDYETNMLKRKEEELAKINAINPQNKLYAAGVLGVFAIVLCIVALPLGVISGIVAIICAMNYSKAKKDKETKLVETQANYDKMINEGKIKIFNCGKQWRDAKQKVEEFNSQPVKKLIG